nr:replication initiation protein [Photobacterium damselae]
MDCTLPQRRLIYSALAYLNPDEDMFRDMTHLEVINACKKDHELCQVRIPLGDFKSHWQLKSKSTIIETERVAEELLSLYWNVEDLESSNDKMVRIIKSIEPADYGYLRLQFTPEMMVYLVQPQKHSKGYTTIPYSFLPRKKSLYSLLFLERCLQKLSYTCKGGKLKSDTAIFEHTIENLKSRFSLDNKDIQFRDFKITTLNKIEKEINSIESCKLTYEVIKRRDSRTKRPKAYKIRFTFQSDKYVKFKSTIQESLEMVNEDEVPSTNYDNLPLSQPIEQYSLDYDDIPF